MLCVLRSSFPQLNSVDKFYKGQNEKYEHCISIGYLPEETSFESEKRESSTWYLNHLIQCKKHSPTWIEKIIAKVIGSRLKVCWLRRSEKRRLDFLELISSFHVHDWAQIWILILKIICNSNEFPTSKVSFEIINS